jgi:hypothetical protein
MRVAPALLIVSLLLLPAVDVARAAPEAGGARTVAEAQRALEAARARLAEAVRRIERDPPSTADLDAAHAAVGALKDAIDAGADAEPRDLDYARAALAARKELRRQREYVDQRRANVHLHGHRRAIDAAVEKLDDRARRLEGRDAGPRDFEEAAAAAEALRKAVEEARPSGRQDPAFARYLAEVDARLERHAQATDARATRQAVETQRARLEEARRALSAAMAPLAPTASTERFDAADRAATQLSTRLEEGRGLEAKDPAYRSDAERARAEVAQARRRMDALFSEAGIARLKGEIEPAHRDLVEAGRAVRTRSPTAEQLAEARTAAIVVRKLLEKFQPQSARIPAFGQYLGEVRKSLEQVELDVQRRDLSAARADLTQALRGVERRDATDEQFDEARTAMVVLEKTLEGVNRRSPDLAPLVADARELLRTARTTLARRRVEVDVQRQRARVEEARRDANGLVSQLYQPGLAPERLQQAEAALEKLRAVLGEGAALAKKDGDYAAYDREVKKRVTELGERVAQRKVALAASEGRGQLGELLAAAKARVAAARQPEATDADLEAATKGVDAVGQALEARASLERQEPGYAAQAARTREALERLQGELAFARQARELRRQTVEALAAGAAAAEAGAAARELRAQRRSLETAVERFRTCKEEGARTLEETRALASATLLVEGRPTPPRDVVALCTQRLEATEPRLREVVGLIAFEEGPKRAFESGRRLLGQGRRSEALAQFEECTSSGRILQNRSPELAGRTFEVAGAPTTLAELAQRCLQQAKALRQ